MDRKQLINALIILVILAIISFFTFKKNLSSWERGNDVEKSKLAENFDVNQVAKLAILTNSGSLKLHKNSNGKWSVAERSDYPVNFTKLSNFLLTLAEIDIIQTPRITKSQLASLQLIMPKKGTNSNDAGTLLTIYNAKGETMLSLLIGEQHFPKQEGDAAPFNVPQADGCYVLKTGSEQVSLINNSLATVNIDPKKWIQKTFFQIPDIVSISLADKENANLWTISRKDLNQPWILADLKKGDKPLPRPMMEATLTFANIAFDDVAPAGKSDFKDAKIVTIKTKRGLVYKIQIIPEGNKFIAKCAVSADLTTPAVKKKESPEEAKKRADLFAKKQELLEKEVNKLKFYTNWEFELPKYKIEKVLKTKSQFYRPADI